MRAIRVASAALLAAGALALSTPAALASDGGSSNITSFGFSVSPSTVAPGGTVTLNANGCDVPTVTASSGVFDTVTLNEGHSATAQVDSDAKPGAQYDVTFNCDGETGTTPLTISTTNATGGVKAGAGGSISSVSPAEIAAGSALVAAALGGAFYLKRRRVDA